MTYEIDKNIVDIHYKMLIIGIIYIYQYLKKIDLIKIINICYYNNGYLNIKWSIRDGTEIQSIQ